MLTYVQWKKIYDVGLNFIDTLETTSDVITGFLTSIGVVESIAVDILVKVIGWIGKWGFKFIMWLIPHEAEDDIGSHPGDMQKLAEVARKSGDKPVSESELKHAANAIPLVALKPALRQPQDAIDDAAVEGVPITPVVASTGVVPPFGTGFRNNLTAREADPKRLLQEDKYRIQHEYMKKTKPYVYMQSPVANTPPLGFVSSRDTFLKDTKLVDLYGYLQPKIGTRGR